MGRQNSLFNQEEDKEIIAILREAESKGRLKRRVTVWQHLELDVVENNLEKIKSETDQVDFLKYDYPCLYFYICGVKGISVDEFMDKCKEFEYAEPELYIYYIHGWLIPTFNQMRANKKLYYGNKEISIDGEICEYRGEMYEGQCFGIGEVYH